jgi:hypothetical protein
MNERIEKTLWKSARYLALLGLLVLCIIESAQATSVTSVTCFNTAFNGGILCGSTTSNVLYNLKTGVKQLPIPENVENQFCGQVGNFGSCGGVTNKNVTIYLVQLSPPGTVSSWITNTIYVAPANDLQCGFADAQGTVYCSSPATKEVYESANGVLVATNTTLNFTGAFETLNSTSIQYIRVGGCYDAVNVTASWNSTLNVSHCGFYVEVKPPPQLNVVEELQQNQVYENDFVGIKIWPAPVLPVLQNVTQYVNVTHVKYVNVTQYVNVTHVKTEIQDVPYTPMWAYAVVALLAATTVISTTYAIRRVARSGNIKREGRISRQKV